LIAGAITEHDDRWRLFLPYELVWAGGSLGRVVHHVASWSRGRVEDWAASLARRREAVQRGAAEPMLDRPTAERPPTERPRAGHRAEPPRTQAPTMMPAGEAEAESPSASEVAQVESLLRRAARHERARTIPFMARTGEATRSDPEKPDP